VDLVAGLEGANPADEVEGGELGDAGGSQPGDEGVVGDEVDQISARSGEGGVPFGAEMIFELDEEEGG
jgi:hypothetical protein